MDFTLTQVRAFLTVARFHSFTQAAELLHISQPALTLQIQQLEESLGLRLFDRDTRHVVLSSSGRNMLPTFQHLFSEVESVVASARGIASKEQGIVRLGCAPSIATTYLPEAIARFRKRHAHISFEVRDEVSRRVVSMVQADEVEIGITNGDPDVPGLDSTELYTDQVHAVFPRSHPLASLKELKLSEVAKYPLVFRNIGFISRTIMDNALAAEGRLVTPACEVTHSSTAIAMVRAGLGVALLGSLTIKANNLESFPELQSHLIDDPVLSREIKLIRKKGRSLSPCAEEFKDLLLDLSKNG
jgi:DNA-binding transcriptional LysR family regulator